MQLSKDELENVLLCAEAAGYIVDSNRLTNFVKDPIRNEHFWFNPYTNNAAAMELLKKYPVECFSAFHDYAHEVMMERPADLNKMIVKSIADLARMRRI